MVAKVPDNYVYLDYAATAPLIEEAAQAMVPYMQPGRANIAYGGNANSLHVPGRVAFAALEDARRRIARALGAQRPDELILTSGATEADNAALFGLANAAVSPAVARARATSRRTWWFRPSSTTPCLRQPSAWSSRVSASRAWPRTAPASSRLKRLRP